MLHVYTNIHVSACVVYIIKEYMYYILLFILKKSILGCLRNIDEACENLQPGVSINTKARSARDDVYYKKGGRKVGVEGCAKDEEKGVRRFTDKLRRIGSINLRARSNINPKAATSTPPADINTT